MLSRRTLVLLVVFVVISECLCEEGRGTNVIRRRKKIKKPTTTPAPEAIEVNPTMTVVEEVEEKREESEGVAPPVSLEVPVLEEVPRPKVQSIIDRLLKKKKKGPPKQQEQQHHHQQQAPQQQVQEEKKIEEDKYIPLAASSGEEQKSGSSGNIAGENGSGSVEVLQMPEEMDIEVVVEDTRKEEGKGSKKGETTKEEEISDNQQSGKENPLQKEATSLEEVSVPKEVEPGVVKGHWRKGTTKRREGSHKQKEEARQKEREEAEQKKREELEERRKEEVEKKKKEEEEEKRREMEEEAANKERIITETMLFRKGVPVDYSYNETSSDSGGVVSVPGCPKSLDGYPWVIWRFSPTTEPSCFLVGHRASVCEGSAVMNYQRGSEHGVCACNFQECLAKRGLPLHIDEGDPLAAGNQLRRRTGLPGKLRYRYCKPMGVNCEEFVYDQKDKRCDILYTQGPCKSGDWLQRNSKGGVECAPRLCQAGHGLTEKSELSHRSHANVTEDNAECCKPWGGFAVASVVTTLGRLSCTSGQIYSETLKKCFTSFKSSGLIVG